MEEVKLLSHVGVVHLQQGYLEVLDVLRRHSIFSVYKLDNLVARRAHSGVILDLDIFESLNESPLDVPSLCRLASCVDEALSPSHCVKVELLRAQAKIVAAGDEALAFWAEVIFTIVRKGSSIETKRYALALNVLLTAARHDL